MPKCRLLRYRIYKQRAAALLLRHGYVWNERTESGRSLKRTWGYDFKRWLSGVEFEDPADADVLAFYARCVEEGSERVERLGRRIQSEARKPRWKPYVDALTLINGIDVQTAFLLAVEFGDFRRFKNGRSVSSWLGTVPSEDSSGPHVVRGPITCAGNSHCRRALIEGVQNIGRYGRRAVKPKLGQSVSDEVLAHCRAANDRLRERYRHLVEEGKLAKNKAKVAVVNEMIRWVWAVGCMVQDEQAAIARQR